MTSEEPGAAANATEVEQSESETKKHAAIIRSPLLDGTFFRVVSMKDGNHLKAVCTACPDGKKAVGSPTSFLNHLKVNVTSSQFCSCSKSGSINTPCFLPLLTLKF